jgi:outer membrane lipoprotein-sorting protein
MMRLKMIPCFLAAALAACIISSCAHESPEEYAEKLEKKNQRYSDYSERRRLRIQARQERTDMWFKRVMGT